MKHSIQEHESLLNDLSNTILDVCRESVTLIKRSDHAATIKLSQQQEWEIYLEFLKVLFQPGGSRFRVLRLHPTATRIHEQSRRSRG